ncbi:UV EXCISION REPAIR PROTEIN RAD23 [Salix purpurea]|uniref:Ubiquitin receptor RAD23 n=1 Tax=Salix purpurea TaxID=77065 RepID=A0A9Q0TKG5_SALPP|nr:UV EXCISION REPAIR PROTEIN RAD23 [Salix purpurea]
MKLTVKTLKGSHFEIKVQPTDTVMGVKKNIEDVQGKDNYPCGQQLLIHNGKVLKDETTLADNKVTEDGFLVVMLSKSKTAAGSSSTQPVSTPPTTAPTSNSTLDAPAPDAQAPVSKSASASDSATANAQSDTYGQAASNLWTTCTLAFQKQQKLLSPVARFPADQGAETGAAPAATTLAPGGPNSSPLNMFPETLSGGGGDAGLVLGSLDFLRNNQQFQALRSMVQANPQILQPMLQELGKQNPQLLRMIQEHNAEFLQLINEPLDGSEGEMFDQPDQEMPHAINVTPAEQEAIERLVAMGFDRALVIEAFLACDRNEELAANYLLENGADFED